MTVPSRRAALLRVAAARRPLAAALGYALLVALLAPLSVMPLTSTRAQQPELPAPSAKITPSLSHPVGSGGRGPNGSFDVDPPPRSREAAPGMPNLEAAKRARDHIFKVPEPLPSTLPRCSPYEGECSRSSLDAAPASAVARRRFEDGRPHASTERRKPLWLKTGYTQRAADQHLTLAAVSATLQSGADYYTPRTQPQNETGEPAVDLGSQNFNWGVSLVNLAGRSGLDLDISLSYNSLVWVKSANSADIKFNVDNGYPAPGFQFAFPILQRVTDAQGTRYMLILPSGARVELRSAGTNTYESADSTYIQLLVTGAATAEARLPNGLIFYFLEYPQNDLQCAAIKDRNGNYISINRDANINNKGRILGITDTLGRTVSFNYDGFGNLSSITQLRAGQTYTWASFDYGAAHTLQPQFSGGLIPTPAVNTNITVLRGVNVADGSSYKFLYTPWGQVWKIEHYAQDAHLLSSTAYNLPGSDLLAASPQPDCPRFTERQDRAANWNGGNPASTTYTFSNARTKVRLPDGTYLREYFATSADWKKGLTTLSELWTSDPEVASPTPVMLKATSFNYTQDDTTLTYPKNPRLQSANFSDDKGNYRMVEYSYTSFGLPNHIREYTGSPAVQRRHTEITYRLDAAYVNRRVIGLVNSRHVYEVNSGVETLVSKISYGYDAAVADTSAQPTQHDSDRAGNGYGVNYNTGRGNMTIAARWDVGDENNWNKTLRETWTYNITTARGVSCA